MRTNVYLLIFLLSVSCSNLNTSRNLTSTETCRSLITSFQAGHLSPLQKARMINNQEGLIKGSFAEIGAGQEIAGTFFRAKRASETIVKTISAYGKEESNRLYGSGQRFVSKERLMSMLEIEFNSLKELSGDFNQQTKLFSVANTVTTNKNGTGHGWIGIRYQKIAGEDPVDLIVHINFSKTTILTQHKDLGKVGVNIIHSAMLGVDQSPAQIVKELTEGIKLKSLDIDFVEINSQSQLTMNNSITLLSNKQTSNALLDSENSYIPKDFFYKKSILIDSSNGLPNSTSELDKISVRKFSFDEISNQGSLSNKQIQDKVKTMESDGTLVWITNSESLLDSLKFVDQGYGSEISMKLSTNELSSLSSSEIKSFITKIKSFNNKFLFEIVGTQDLLSPETKRLIERL
jgi:hypothetical protein